MKSDIKHYLNNVSVKLTIILLLLIVPVILFSIINNYQSRNLLIHQTEVARKEALSSYLFQIDNEMDNARSYGNSMTFYNNLTSALLYRENSTDFYYAGNTLKRNIVSYSAFNTYISGYFCFVPQTDFHLTYLLDTFSLNHSEEFRQFIQETVCPAIMQNSNWSSFEFMNTDYLMQGFYRNGIYFGTCINLSALQTSMGKGSDIRFTTKDHLESLEDSSDPDSLLFTVTSSVSPLAAYSLYNTKELFSTLPFFQKYITFISILLLIIIPVIFLILNHLILNPLRNLKQAMSLIQNGNLDYQIPDLPCSNEFRQLNHNFNGMIQQINKLKISIYEEKLHSQKTQMRSLQLQLRPHFMINSLNMVYNGIVNRDTNTAMKLIQFSINYLRFMVKTEEDFVPLKQEADHINNYLSIQKLRYNERFSYSIRVDPFIESAPVPPLLIQNFVENSVKYGIDPVKPARIGLLAEYREIDCKPYLFLKISDNGCGYPDALLASADQYSMKPTSGGIGLRNSFSRVRLLYGSEASWHLYNEDGAVSEFLLPIPD